MHIFFLSQSLLHALSILDMSPLIVVQDLVFETGICSEMKWWQELIGNINDVFIRFFAWYFYALSPWVIIIFSLSSIWIHISNTWSFSSAFKHLTSWLLFSLTLWGTDSALNFNWVCSTHFLTFWYHLLWENQY